MATLENVPFARLSTRTYFCCHYETLKNNNLLQNRQGFFRRVREIYLTWILLVTLSKKGEQYSSLSKTEMSQLLAHNLRMAPEIMTSTKKLTKLTNFLPISQTNRRSTKIRSKVPRFILRTLDNIEDGALCENI